MSATRMLGVWPAKDDMPESEAKRDACLGLAKLCGQNLVLPTGDPSFATFSDRCDILLAAHALGVKLVEVLALAEKIGFKRNRSFIAAVVDVRGLTDDEEREDRRRLRSVG